MISEHKVNLFSQLLPQLEQLKKEDPNGEFFKKYDLSKFDKLFLAGERADPDTIKWFEKLSNSPVIDHWWQTETSWAITSDCTGIESFPVKYGSAFKPVPGYDLKVLNSEGKEVGPGKMGDIVVKLPLLQELFQHFGVLIKDIKKIICLLILGIIKLMTRGTLTKTVTYGLCPEQMIL